MIRVNYKKNSKSDDLSSLLVPEETAVEAYNKISGIIDPESIIEICKFDSGSAVVEDPIITTNATGVVNVCIYYVTKNNEEKVIISDSFKSIIDKYPDIDSIVFTESVEYLL
jgi:hypothetical protein